MTLIKSETREDYTVPGHHITAETPAWKVTPMLGPPRSIDPIDVVFLDLQTGAIDLAAAAQRVREIIGAAEVASANQALAGWVGDEPSEVFDYEDDGYRCPYCHRAECSH